MALNGELDVLGGEDLNILYLIWIQLYTDLAVVWL